MENDNERVNIDEVEEIEEILDEEGNDTTDWKALALKNQGIAKRFQTKFKKLAETKKSEPEKTKEPEKQESKKEGFDEAQLTYLEIKGVTSEEDIAYVEKMVKDSGKTLRELFNAVWFQNDLKERKESRVVKEATPKGTKRVGGTSVKDDVDYWLAQDDTLLPPPDQVELRRKVINARMAREKRANKFAPTGPLRIV